MPPATIRHASGYKKDDTYFMPIMIAPGQVMEMKTFDEMMSTPLTLSMANSLTIEQLNKALRALDAGSSDPKHGQKGHCHTPCELLGFQL